MAELIEETFSDSGETDEFPETDMDIEEDESGEEVSYAEEELQRALQSVDGRTADTILRLHRQIAKLKQRKQELKKGTKGFEESVKGEVENRIKEIMGDYNYEKERILRNKESDTDRIQKKIDSKKERLRKDAEEKTGVAEVRKRAEVAQKAREKIESDLTNLSPELRKLHEDEFLRWIEEAKTREEEANRELAAGEVKVKEQIELLIAEYEVDLRSDIMNIEDKARSDLAALEKSVGERKLKIQDDLDRKLTQRQMVLIQDNNVLISETMEQLDNLVANLQDPMTKVLVEMIMDSVKVVDFVERKNYSLKRTREEDRKKKKMQHFQELMEIERKQLEKRQAYLSREREAMMKELEEKSKNIIKKEMSLKEQLERGIEERLEACAEDARCKAEDVVKEEYEKRMLELERDYKRKLLAYKKKVLQYRKQQPGAAISSGVPPTPEPADKFPCLNCKSQIIIPTRKRPVTVRCLKCGKEYTLRAPKRETGPARAPAASTQALPSPLDDLPDLDGLDEDKTTATPPPPSELSDAGDAGTKIVTCPH